MAVDPSIPARAGERPAPTGERARRNRWTVAVPVAAVGLAVAALSLTLPVLPRAGTGPTAQAAVPTAPLSPPAVPSDSAYLGAFVSPDQQVAQSQSDIRVELSELGEFDGAFGRPLGLVHVFQDWHDPVKNSVLAAVASTGATPVVDWGCTSDATIISGSQDSLITSYATALKKYGRPVFLRWFWEMNLDKLPRAVSCLAGLGATGYVEAWQHIWTIFHQVGATNVAFVWCPSVDATTPAAATYYPGSSFVDWIGFDGYDRKQDPTVITTAFVPFYEQWSTEGKPMMIGETGATSDQATFIGDLAAALPTTFPDIKAVLYYDSESTLDWTLTDQPGNLGFSQFVAMGQAAYFAFPFAGS